MLIIGLKTAAGQRLIAWPSKPPENGAGYSFKNLAPTVRDHRIHQGAP